MEILIPVTELNYRYIKKAENLDHQDYFHASNESPINKFVQMLLKKQEYSAQSHPLGFSRYIKVKVDSDFPLLFDLYLDKNAVDQFNKAIYFLMIKELHDIHLFHKNLRSSINYFLSKYDIDDIISHEGLRKALYRYRVDSKMGLRQRNFENKIIEKDAQ